MSDQQQMSDQQPMSDIDLFTHVLTRPQMYCGSRSASAVLAFFSGHATAREELNLPPKAWNDILWKVLRRLQPDPDNTHTLWMVLDRLAGGDEERALQILIREVETLLGREL